MKSTLFKIGFVLLTSAVFMGGCKPNNAGNAVSGDASKAYVAPGKYDEFYNFVSGGRRILYMQM